MDPNPELWLWEVCGISQVKLVKIDCNYSINFRIVKDGMRQMYQKLCSALKLLHKSGFVHRDIRPENIILCLDNSEMYTPYLADLGHASKIVECTSPLVTLLPFASDNLLTQVKNHGMVMNCFPFSIVFEGIFACQ